MREPADIKVTDKHVYLFVPVINNESNSIVEEQPAGRSTSERTQICFLLQKKVLAAQWCQEANTPPSSGGLIRLMRKWKRRSTRRR